METWKTILSSAAFSAAICTILVWLFREWISVRLRKSIQHEYDVKLEEYKAGCTRFLTENEIRFSRWHEEKLKAIKEIYHDLAEVTYSLAFLLSLENDPRLQVNENSKKEMRKAVVERHVASMGAQCQKWIYYRLFIEDDEDKIIVDFFKGSNNLFSLYYNCMITNDVDMLRKEGPKILEELDVIANTLRRKFQDILQGKEAEQAVNKK